MMAPNRISLSGVVRLVAALAVCVATMSLTGCATVVATPYQPTNDNVRSLQALPGGLVSLGEFTAKSPDLNHLSIRSNSFTSPFNDSFAEYLKAALRSELEASGKLDPKSPVVITGELQTNSIDPAMGTANAHISARIVIKRGNETVFDKVVHGDSEWESSFIGAIAIPMARQQYGETLKKLLANLFADPSFKKVL
jgi:hypothetical protein